MPSHDKYVAIVAQCEYRAKNAQNHDDKQSWLAIADSWKQTAQLKRSLERQKQLLDNAKN